MKLKKDGTPKKSGGKRAGSYVQPKKAPPANLPDWDAQLKRALRLATNNQFFLPSTKFFTKTEIARLYGKKALAEFSYYFKSVRKFDQDRADKVRQKQAMGLFAVKPDTWPEKAEGFYTPEKYANWLIKHKCYGWISTLKFEFHQEMWMEYADHGKL